MSNTELLKSLGATHVLDRGLTTDALRAEVSKITPQPIKVALDAISVPTTQNAAYDILAPGGQLVITVQDSIDAEKKAAQPDKTVVHVFASLTFPEHLKAGASLCAKLTGLLEEGVVKVRAINPNACSGV